MDRFKFRGWDKPSDIFPDGHMSYYDIRQRIMDRFKFRGWDKPSDIFPDGHMSYYDIRQRIGDVDIIMQCTGLKDKNGKLIYEGDIINHNRYVSKGLVKNGQYILKAETKHDRPKHHIGWYVEEYTAFRDRGYKDNKSLEELFFYIDDNYSSKRFDDSIEIIGNIHQNKDLLND